MDERIATHEDDRVAPIAGALARDDWPVLVGLPAVASLFVFAVPRLGWWAMGAAALVYAAGFLGYERARATNAAYRQLTEVLGRLPELSGAVPAGHADRVAALAGSVGGRLGLRAADIATVEDAARCRAIGRVAAGAPGDVRRGADEHAVARWSAGILARAGRLERLVALVAPHAAADPQEERLRAIVDVAAAYDAAVVTKGDDMSSTLQHLAGSGRAEVVQALAASVGPGPR